MTDSGGHQQGETNGSTELPPSIPIPDAADYWAHKIADEAKKKVIAYFAVLGILVSLIVTLFGMDRIRTLIEKQYEDRVTLREAEATRRIDELSNAFESRLRSLEERAEARSVEFHRSVGVTLQQIQEAGGVRSTLLLDLSESIGPIRDQGNEGTTVGFALAYALTAEVRNATGRTPAFSARSIYVEARKRDEWPGEEYEGTSLRGGLAALQEIGAYSEADWSYDRLSGPAPGATPQQSISGFTFLPQDRIDLIISRLRENRPVVATINVTEAFGTVGDDGRINIGPEPQLQGGHAICIVGYDGGRDEFKFANMWGAEWGAGGFGFIGRSDLARIITGAAVITL